MRAEIFIHLPSLNFNLSFMYMDSVGNPRTFVPYINTEDCSQGFCSLNCPQWCYIIFPPPPPLEFPGDRDSPSSFSPLWITIVGILASAFILVSYYAIISKYCRNSSSTSQENQHSNLESGSNNWNTSLHEAWELMNSGLEEGLIKSISVCRYKKGGKSIEGTECSVCLNEFQDGEDLRVLPKCPHAFHVNCIDTWLRSHSNCPLCRSNIALLSPSTDLVTVTEQNSANEPDAAEENGGRNIHADAEGDEVERDVVIEISGEEQRGIRRSVSMDAASTVRSICVADILEMDDDEEEVGELNRGKDGKQQDHVNGRMKRSHSSGVLRLPC